MPRLSVGELKPGMTLSRPVVNERGTVLLPGGIELEPKIIEKISAMGVDTVFVKGTPACLPPREQVDAVLDRRFKMVEGSAEMCRLKESMKKHLEGLYGGSD